MKWKQLKQYVISSCLSFLLCVSLILSPISYTGVYASTTSGNEIENAFKITENYVRDNFNALCRYVVRWNAIISDGLIGTFDNFENWLNSSGNGDIWSQHPHSPIRVQNGVENVEVPQEVLNVINQYVIYQIQQNPMNYTQCFIQSYSSLNPSPFSSYGRYNALKEFIKNQDGWCLVCCPNTNIGRGDDIYIAVLDKSCTGFFGTTLNGNFTNVQFTINWATGNSANSQIKKRYVCHGNGTIESTNSLFGMIGVKNTSSVSPNSTYSNIFTNTQKSEPVFVFNTLDAYKNYMSGTPKPYYLTSEGMSQNMSNWQVGSGTINTGTLNTANSTYSQVTNNITNGLSADDVLKIVDYVVTHTDGSSGSDDEEEDDNPITKLIKEIVGGIGGFLTGLIEGIADALLGEVNPETGLREGGLLASLKNIFTSLLETLTGGVIFDFLSAFMSWLPEDIINVLTALFGVAVTFAVIKCVRNAL